MIIAFEGIDGAGKSTAVLGLTSLLSKSGTEHVVVGNASFLASDWYQEEDFQDADEPDILDDDDDDDEPRVCLPDSVLAEWGPRALCLGKALEFVHEWESLARPALEAGHLVIADRYVASAVVRDTVRGVDETYVRAVYGFLPPPELTIYIDTPAQTAYRRKIAEGIPIGLLEMGYPGAESPEIKRQAFIRFQTACRQKYPHVLAPHRVKIIDGSVPTKEVQARVNATVREAIGLTE